MSNPIKEEKDIVDILYFALEKIPPEGVVESEVYIKYEGEFIHVADIIDKDYTHLFDKLKALNKSKTKFCMVYNKSMLKMAHELSGGALKIIMYMMSKLSFNNCVYDVKYADISGELGMSFQTITGAFAELTEKKYLLATGKRTNIVYHLSPGLCWRGSVYNMYKKLKMFAE